MVYATQNILFINYFASLLALCGMLLADECRILGALSYLLETGNILTLGLAVMIQALSLKLGPYTALGCIWSASAISTFTLLATSEWVSVGAHCALVEGVMTNLLSNISKLIVPVVSWMGFVHIHHKIEQRLHHIAEKSSGYSPTPLFAALVTVPVAMQSALNVAFVLGSRSSDLESHIIESDYILVFYAVIASPLFLLLHARVRKALLRLVFFKNANPDSPTLPGSPSFEEAITVSVSNSTSTSRSPRKLVMTDRETGSVDSLIK